MRLAQGERVREGGLARWAWGRPGEGQGVQQLGPEGEHQIAGQGLQALEKRTRGPSVVRALPPSAPQARSHTVWIANARRLRQASSADEVLLPVAEVVLQVVAPGLEHVEALVASRPEEFHLRPLTERCGSLSAHTAPTKQPTASLPPRSPPVASWTLTTTAWPNPFAPAALPAFLARTGWSVPVLRIGTLASWWSPLGLLPWHRSDRFPQFHMRARIKLAPPLRRSPSAPYPGVRRTDPRGSRSLWF